MPSPDATPYVDLTLYDVSAQDLFTAALANAQTRLPGWVPAEGDTAVVLMESLALIAAEGIFAINRLPGAVVQVLLGLFGIATDPGVQATATVSFICINDGLTHTLPGGTRLQVDGPGGSLPMTTSQAVVVAAGATSIVAPVTFADHSASPNTIPAATPVQLVDALSFVNGASLATSPAGGRDPETSEGYFSRASQVFSRLVATYVLPVHFEAAALQNPAVSRAFALDNYDPGGAHPTSPGLDGGNVTVAVYGPAGVVGDTDKATLLATLQAGALANLQVFLIDPTLVTLPVTVAVRPLPGYGALPVPGAPLLAAVTGTGTLAAGIYSYELTRVSASGETTGSVSASITTTSTGAVQVTLPPGGGNFDVYRGTVRVATGVNGATWLDQGAAGVTAAPPTSDQSSPLVGAVTAALTSYLSAQTWDWSPLVRYTKLLQVVSAVPGVDFVVSMTPSVDTALSGVAPLVQAGVINVSVTS